jgi:hypothetical protein
MTVGFDRPSYVLSFDQRESFQTKMYSWKGTLTGLQAAVAGARRYRKLADPFKQPEGG